MVVAKSKVAAIDRVYVAVGTLIFAPGSMAYPFLALRSELTSMSCISRQLLWILVYARSNHQKQRKDTQ